MTSFSLRYVDFTSLYPWCNKMTRTVVGHPRIITENFEDISTYFGMIKCTVLPPRGLFHPVLPYRTQGKLMFPSASCVPIRATRPPVPIPTTKEPFKERGVAWRKHWRKATKSCNSTRYGVSLNNRTNCSKTT